MKRGLFLYILTFLLVIISLLLVSVSLAAVPDSDFDGVPNENDKCPNSVTTTVDQFGCSCEQKNCASDNNICTDDCSVINGIPACVYTNNNNPCSGGYCAGGKCVSTKKEDYIIKDDIVVVRESAGKGVASASDSAASLNENLGPQSTLVIVAGVGDKQPSADVETARRLVFGNDYGTVNDFYIKNSFGKASLVGKVVGPYKLPGDSDTLADAVKAADPYVNFRDYSRIILDLPNDGCEGYGGYASIGKFEISTDDGNISASVSWDCYFDLFVVGHELGHNFGMHHANRLECFHCDSIEYGGFYDIMDGSPRHLNAPHKEESGWLSDNTIVTSEGEYLIKPLETKQPSSIIQQIKLPLKVLPPFYKLFYDYGYISNVYYTLEFRKPVDYDANHPDIWPDLPSAVLIHLSAVPSYPATFQTNIINLDKYAYLLTQAGQTYRDSSNDYEITLRSISTNDALVKITRFAGINQKPTGSFEMLGNDTGKGGETGIDLVASGWALDPNTPNEPIYVLFYEDGPPESGTYLGKALAILQPIEVRGYPGDHDFIHYIAQNDDGNEHKIYAYAEDSWNGPLAELNNSPQTYISTTLKPELSIKPIDILQGDTVWVTVANAQPNSSILAHLRLNKEVIMDGASLGITDENGKWSQSFVSTDWSTGLYSGFVTVSGVPSNTVDFFVQPNTKKCPTTLSNLSPSGSVKAIGDPTYVTLSWPYVNEATYYNVRLDDGTYDRYDDPIFKTCQNSPYYYCENGITSTSITNVPVKPGRTYSFWVEPIIPDCGYFNGDTVFSVTNLQKIPKLEVKSSSRPLPTILRGDVIQVRISDAPPNSQIYYTIYVNNNLIADMAYLSVTKSDGTFYYEVPSEWTSGWMPGNYRAFVTIHDSAQNKDVTSNEVIFTVI